MNWLIPADCSKYNLFKSFIYHGFVDWHQGRYKFSVGDTVYIYCTSPIQKIKFKCTITKLNLSFDDTIDDVKCWVDLKKYADFKTNKFIRLKLARQVSNDNLSLDVLKKNGLKCAPRGPMKISDPSLNAHLVDYFSDDDEKDFHPDSIGDSDTNNEGIKKLVLVNRYERSSKAREQAIRYHKIECVVCGINFEETYGEIGRGFIHVHHLTPISTIGKDYKVDYETDLRPVCPNCHAMLHRKINGGCLTIDELKQILKNKSKV